MDGRVRTSNKSASTQPTYSLYARAKSAFCKSTSVTQWQEYKSTAGHWNRRVRSTGQSSKQTIALIYKLQSRAKIRKYRCKRCTLVLRPIKITNVLLRGRSRRDEPRMIHSHQCRHQTARRKDCVADKIFSYGYPAEISWRMRRVTNR